MKPEISVEEVTDLLKAHNDWCAARDLAVDEANPQGAASKAGGEATPASGRLGDDLIWQRGMFSRD